jgi:hypothetical protein
VTKVTSHQGTHTYRLSKFLKIVFAAPDPKARLQHRRKIMNPFLHFVKLNVHLTAKPDSPTTAENTACCRRAPHSTALNTFVNTSSKINSVISRKARRSAALKSYRRFGPTGAKPIIDK